MKLLPFEIWRDIKGYEGLYMVSNYGNVKSLARDVVESSGKVKHIKERILKPGPLRGGYPGVALHKNGKQLTKKIHRLVAEAFIPNPLGLPMVNHKDENPKNCAWYNLEWCSKEYNVNYGTAKERVKQKKQRAVIQYTLDMEFVKEWDSILEAASELKISHISEVCRGRFSQACGFIWKYKEEA